MHHVTGGVRIWLRLEGAAVLALSVFLYARGGHSWALFALLILAPDVAMIGYLAGSRFGAVVYNLAHVYVGPVLLAMVWMGLDRPPVPALIWAAHIGLDRMLGYGLKYPSGFGDTHLGHVGKTAHPSVTT
jgi:predicted Co/Zn/Cd cation transporter (cation efflux family)